MYIVEEIDMIRRELHEAIEKGNKDEILEISHKLDLLVFKYTQSLADIKNL